MRFHWWKTCIKSGELHWVNAVVQICLVAATERLLLIFNKCNSPVHAAALSVLVSPPLWHIWADRLDLGSFVAAAPSEVAAIFILVTSTPQCSLSCSRCMSCCCFFSAAQYIQTRGPSVSFDRLCGGSVCVGWRPKENQISLTIHQGGIVGWVRLRPSRLFCPLQSSDAQPARRLTGFGGGGTEWIRAFACDYYIFIPLAEPSDSYASSQQGVVTTQRRSGNIFLWSNSNWSAEACKLITSSQLLVVLFGIKSNYTQSETAFRCLDHPNVWKQCNLERQLYSMAKTCGL